MTKWSAGASDPLASVGFACPSGKVANPLTGTQVHSGQSLLFSPQCPLCPLIPLIPHSRHIPCIPRVSGSAFTGQPSTSTRHSQTHALASLHRPPGRGAYAYPHLRVRGNVALTARSSRKVAPATRNHGAPRRIVMTEVKSGAGLHCLAALLRRSAALHWGIHDLRTS